MPQTTFDFSESNKKYYRSEIAKLQRTGNGPFEKGTREPATKLVYTSDHLDEMGLPFEDFSRWVNSTSVATKKEAKPDKKPVLRRTSKAENITFKEYSDFYKSLCDKFQWVPDDQTMNRIACIFGYTRSIAGATRAGREKEGYVFKRVHNGFEVTLPISISEIELTLKTLREKLLELKSEYKDVLAEIKKFEKILKSRSVSSGA